MAKEKIDVYDPLVLDLMLPTVIEDASVPLIAFVPSVLHDLHLSLVTQGMNDSNVIDVTDANLANLSFVLQRHQSTPRFEGVFHSLQWRMEEIAVQIGRFQVFEGFLQRAFNLFLHGVARVVWQRFVKVLSANGRISKVMKVMEWEDRNNLTSSAGICLRVRRCRLR